jgi:hypothetical protein
VKNLLYAAVGGGAVWYLFLRKQAASVEAIPFNRETNELAGAAAGGSFQGVVANAAVNALRDPYAGPPTPSFATLDDGLIDPYKVMN